VKQMKTKWGTCNIEAGRIWLNLELIKKPAYCLEYIIVHEMVHLLERHHNERFLTYMNRFMPLWQHYREELNRAPLGHETWEY
jgi:predicted metal-dependent hydrolase